MKRLLLCIAAVLLQSAVFAQTDNDVVLEVAGEKVQKGEFVRMFKKNSLSKDTVISQSELNDYLELFINYKMKLAQARELGLDTMKSYLDEVKHYREQLVAPYLNDASVNRQLVREAYDRSKEIVYASHILVNIPANATPDDTLAAYNKALQIRKRALAGEDFGKLAEELSDDPSARDRVDDKTRAEIKGNKGSLGYFTSMSMIYPFETACYSMKAGEVSMPVRTRFGYHIIKLHERIPAFCSTMDIAHIWIGLDKHSEEEAESLINKAWQDLNKGISFDSIAKAYSEDKYSSVSGGILSNQRVSTLPVEYVEQLKNLQPQQLSKPFRSQLGWHIVKPLEYRPLPSFEQQEHFIEERIARDERSYKTVESFAEKSKKEYGFKENKARLEGVVKIVTDSVFEGKWKVPSDFDDKEELFRIGDYSYTVTDFAKAIEVNQKKRTPEYIPEFVDRMYKDVVLEQVISYVDSKLEDKYPDLKATIDEFRDGILIFAITDKMIWNKSITDTIGLQAFYEANKEKYKWGKRASVTLWSVDSEEKNLKTLEKVLNKSVRKSWGDEETVNKIAKAFKIKVDADKHISHKWFKLEKGDNKVVDKLVWDNPELKENSVIRDTISSSRRSIALVFHGFVSPEVKTLEECKGMATSDYQSLLEKEWIDDLRNKYTYRVNQEVYRSIR